MFILIKINSIIITFLFKQLLDPVSHFLFSIISCCVDIPVLFWQRPTGKWPGGYVSLVHTLYFLTVRVDFVLVRFVLTIKVKVWLEILISWYEISSRAFDLSARNDMFFDSIFPESYQIQLKDVLRLLQLKRCDFNNQDEDTSWNKSVSYIKNFSSLKKQINRNWEQIFQISRSWNRIFIVSNLPLYFLQLNLQLEKLNEYIHLSLESFKTLTREAIP